MNYVLVFRPEVRKELDEAYSWYESQELGLGDDFLEQVDVTTRLERTAKADQCCGKVGR